MLLKQELGAERELGEMYPNGCHGNPGITETLTYIMTFIILK